MKKTCIIHINNNNKNNTLFKFKSFSAVKIVIVLLQFLLKMT